MTAMFAPTKLERDKTMRKQSKGAAIDIAAVQSRMLTIRSQQVLLDRDVAALYGVETKALNQAVKRNAERFADGYVFQLNAREVENWKSQIVTSNLSEREVACLKMGVRRAPYAFTERGLYMLATVLNSNRAVCATKAIIETYAKVRSLKRELLELHKDEDRRVQASKLRHFGETLADIVMPDLGTVETESSLELNFLIGKLKHTVKRVKKSQPVE